MFLWIQQFLLDRDVSRFRVELWQSVLPWHPCGSPTSSQSFSGPLLVNPTSSSRQAPPSWERPRQKRRLAPWTSRHSTGLRPAWPVWGGRKGRNRRPWCWCCPGRGRASRSACRGRQRVFSSCLTVKRNFYFCSQLWLCYSYTAVRQIGSGSYVVSQYTTKMKCTLPGMSGEKVQHSSLLHLFLTCDLLFVFWK